MQATAAPAAVVLTINNSQKKLTLEGAAASKENKNKEKQKQSTQFKQSLVKYVNMYETTLL